MKKEGVAYLIRFLYVGAVLVIFSSCASNFTGKIFETGRTHEVYAIPIAQKETVWELDGKYYVWCTQGECSKVYEATYDLSDFPDCPNTLYWNSDSVNKEVLCRVEVGDNAGTLKKTEILNFFDIKEAVPEEEFDFSRARSVGGVELNNRKVRYGDYYLIPSGEISRSAGGYATQLSLPAVAVFDTVIMLPQYAGILLIYPFRGMMSGRSDFSPGSGDSSTDSDLSDDDNDDYDYARERNERNANRGRGFQMGKDKVPWIK